MKLYIYHSFVICTRAPCGSIDDFALPPTANSRNWYSNQKLAVFPELPGKERWHKKTPTWSSPERIRVGVFPAHWVWIVKSSPSCRSKGPEPLDQLARGTVGMGPYLLPTVSFCKLVFYDAGCVCVRSSQRLVSIVGL